MAAVLTFSRKFVSHDFSNQLVWTHCRGLLFLRLFFDQAAAHIYVSRQSAAIAIGSLLIDGPRGLFFQGGLAQHKKIARTRFD